MSSVSQSTGGATLPSGPKRIDFEREGLTDKEREILMVAAAYQGRDDASLKKIVDNVSSNRQMVKATLGKHLDRDQIPRGEAADGRKSVFDRSYEDLTEKQRAVVNEAILHPELGTDALAKRANVSEYYAYYVYHAFSHIIEPRQEEESFNV